MKAKQEVLNQILASGLLPLFYHDEEDVSLDITRALYKGGIRVLEYTNRGANALRNFKVLKNAQQLEMPELSLGIGTIKTVHEADAFINAGADYIVAPIIDPEVGKLTAQYNMLWIPGCMTPTEIQLACLNEAAMIKIFPANVLGAGFISSVKELFPGQLFMPTGGVELTAENISGWFKAGVSAVGMGSKLITKRILAERQYDQLYTDTVNALNLVRSSR